MRVDQRPQRDEQGQQAAPVEGNRLRQRVVVLVQPNQNHLNPEMEAAWAAATAGE